jgi:sugar phosphate isomerase/epimerase
MMKVGVCLSFKKVEGLEEKFKTLREEGFDNCQLLATVPALFTDENVELIKSLTAQYGITISTVWCGWEGPQIWNFYGGPKTLGLIPIEYREMRVKNLCDGLDFAKKLGVVNVATHMGFIYENPNEPDYEPFCDAVRVVAEHAKKNGQYLLFETGQETPIAMIRCFETVGCDNLGVNLDTANLILYGKANPVDALDIFGKYVRNMHAKDGLYPVSGRSLGREVRIGEGKVDFKGVLSKLYDYGYDGYVTIEREISGEQQIEDIRHAREYLTKIIEDIYKDKQ